MIVEFITVGALAGGGVAAALRALWLWRHPRAASSSTPVSGLPKVPSGPAPGDVPPMLVIPVPTPPPLPERHGECNCD